MHARRFLLFIFFFIKKSHFFAEFHPCIRCGFCARCEGSVRSSGVVQDLETITESDEHAGRRRCGWFSGPILNNGGSGTFFFENSRRPLPVLLEIAARYVPAASFDVGAASSSGRPPGTPAVAVAVAVVAFSYSSGQCRAGGDVDGFVIDVDGVSVAKFIGLQMMPVVLGGIVSVLIVEARITGRPMHHTCLSIHHVTHRAVRTVRPARTCVRREHLKR